MTPKHRACSHVIQYPVFCPNNIYGRCHTQIYDIYGIKNIFFLLFYVFILTSFLLIPVCRGHEGAPAFLPGGGAEGLPGLLYRETALSIEPMASCILSPRALHCNVIFHL